MVAIVKKNVQDATKPIPKDIMKGRTETDKYWIYMFLVIVFIWFAACTYLCCIKDELQPYKNHACIFSLNETDEIGDFLARSSFNIARLEEHTKERGPIVVYLNLVLYGALLIFATFAIFLRVYHKYCGHCLLICIGMQIVSVCYRAMMYFNYDSPSSIVPWQDEFICWDIPDFAAIFICLILIFVVAMRKGINATVDSIRKTLRFYYFHLYSLLFGLLVLSMMASLMCFTFVIIKGVGTKNISLALPLTILFGSSYLMLVYYYLGVAVISLTTANSYWKHDGKRISPQDVVGSIVLIFKYHFGTVCFNATGILPLTWALCALLESMCRTIRARSGFAKKYIMVAFFFFVGEYSTIITAIDGKNYKHATDRFIHLPIEARRVAKNLRENQMIWMIIGLIMISVNNLLLIFKWMFCEDDPYFTQTAIFSYASIIYLFMPVALIADVVMDTILLCDVEKGEAINGASNVNLVDLPTDVAVAK